MNNKLEVLKGFVENSIRNILGGSDSFNVDISQSTKNIILQIATSKEDRGRVIGKKGMIVDALKVLSVGVKNAYFPEDRRKVILEILEEDDTFRGDRNV